MVTRNVLDEKGGEAGLIFDILVFIISLVMVAYIFRHLFFTYYALFGTPQQRLFRRIAGIYQPRVTVLIPAHNEEHVIGNLLERITELTYPKDRIEVIVIDDASTDRTGEIADEFARRYHNIKVIHRRNGGRGKPDALSTGIKFSNGEVILTFDADYCPQLDVIEKLVAPFVDPEVGAVQGRVTVVNEEDSIVSKIVTLERIGGYRVDQTVRDELVLIPQYAGTVGGFRREVLKRVGGWDANMLAEDTDLTIRCILKGYQVRYVGDAECYEEAVTTWRTYWNQRYRWAKGHMQCAFRHLGNVLKTKHLSALEKAELTLLLGIYFVPILIMLGWIAGVGAYLTNFKTMIPFHVLILSTFTYSAVGNFAPFFEVGAAAYLDNRRRLLWLLPILTLPFLMMVVCCTKAFIDLVLTWDGYHKWNHTSHMGNGYDGRRKGFNGLNCVKNGLAPLQAQNEGGK